MISAVFLDREGVLTPQLAVGAYVLREEQAILAPDTASLKALCDRGIRLFIVSNQSCVGRGLVSFQEAMRLHQVIVDKLAAQGVIVTDSRVCPHADRDGCACRKPKPGMIFDLCRAYGIDPATSVLIGDAARDVEAGKAAGCRMNFLMSSEPGPEGAVTVASLTQAVDRIRQEQFLHEFRARFAADDIVRMLESIRNLKVLVLGETIVDEYHYVQSMGRTGKSNIVAGRFVSEEAMGGGVVACANHVAGFCEHVAVLTCLGGTDSKEAFIRSCLKSNVQPTFLYRQNMPTIVKRRFVEAGSLHKLYEVYYFNDAPNPPELERALHVHLETVLPRYDVVIALDYGHAFFSPATINLLAERARFLAVNTQLNAGNIGYNTIDKYPRADFICLNESELRLSARDRFGSLESLLADAVKKTRASRAIITRGSRGCLTYEAQGGFRSVPICAKRTVDAVGTGDAFFAIASPLASVGASMEAVGFIGNAAGAMAAAIVGNRAAVDPAGLRQYLKTLLA